MNAFFQDVWHDLRAKRLLPVVAAMVIALLAIPAVMIKSAAAPPAPDSAAPTTDQRRGASLALDADTAAASGKGSSLDVFAPGDPFVPPKSVTAKSDGASIAVADVASAGTEEASGSPQGGGSPSAPGGGHGTPDDSPDSPAPVAPKTTEYEYVADITFWNGDRRRRMSGLRKLDMLPSESKPVLIFMGATSDGGNAVFLVDSTLEATGEGTCQPSRSNCAFVRLGPGSEHVFSTEAGDAYRLRIDEIRRVTVKAGAADAPGARTAVGDGVAPAKRFTLPSLVDLIAVTGDGDGEDDDSDIPAGDR